MNDHIELENRGMTYPSVAVIQVWLTTTQLRLMHRAGRWHFAKWLQVTDLVVFLHRQQPGLDPLNPHSRI